MTERDFCYWLQGFFEINGVDGEKDLLLNHQAVKTIKEHLQLVFRKETGAGSAHPSPLSFPYKTEQPMCSFPTSDPKPFPYTPGECRTIPGAC